MSPEMLSRFKFALVVFVLLGTVAACPMACAGPPHVNNRDGLKHQPKNVIILIADGCGFNHVKAADYYQCGLIPCQLYEDFPVQLAMSTYPSGWHYDPNSVWASFDYVRENATDSAAAATAIATGVKTFNQGIGVDVNGVRVPNIVEQAEKLGKATGVITSVPFSHATPAAFVAHTPDRDNFGEIARQMVFESAVDVVMGCGHPLYDNNGGYRRPGNLTYIGGETLWMGLTRHTAGGDADGDGIPDLWQLIQTRLEFQTLMTGDTPKRVFGVPQVYETLQEYRSGSASVPPYAVPLTQTVPTLEEMSRGAINVLDDDPDGFFLMIEGGAVDWAAQSNRSGRLIEEMVGFNKSVDAVLAWVEQNSNWGETLLIVTADHESGYLTGPGSGQKPTGPVWNDIVNYGEANMPGMEWHTGGHTNSLVPFFAKGRGAKLFKETIDGNDPVRGPYIDNTDIANIIFALWREQPPGSE